VALHSINVKSAMQVIDLVLEDAGMPSRCMDDPRLSTLVQAMHAYFFRSPVPRGETRQTQAAFEERLSWLR
jgi:hypothetical protein